MIMILILSNILIILAIYLLIGKNTIYIAFIIIVAYIYLRKDEYTTNKIASSDTISDTQLQTFLNDIEHINKYNKAAIHRHINLFFENYVELLMNKYDQGIFNLLLNSRKEILKIINEIDQQNELGYDKTEELSELVMKFTWKYINVIVQRYNIDFKYPIAYNHYEHYSLYA